MWNDLHNKNVAWEIREIYKPQFIISQCGGHIIQYLRWRQPINQCIKLLLPSQTERVFQSPRYVTVLITGRFVFGKGSKNNSML
jgi:hypothetical protein